MKHGEENTQEQDGGTQASQYILTTNKAVRLTQNNWGKLFDGASIDIYEWTASPVLPEEWINLVAQKTIVDGQQASGEAFSILINGQTVYNWTQEDYYGPQANKQKQYITFGLKTNQIVLETVTITFSIDRDIVESTDQRKLGVLSRIQIVCCWLTLQI